MKKDLMYKGWLFVLIFFILYHASAISQQITRQEYIETYSELAIKEMQRTGIPASITLAQGILESGDGNSTLARKGNNHFGIKCHNDWNGKRIYHDDDAKNECFRKYKTVYDSYRDHSDFLTTRSRYRFLFEFNITDYKAWAHGLKKAGYATSRTYDKALIKIIEENELFKFDDASYIVKKRNENIKTKEESIPKEIHLNNNIKYVFAKQGDNLDIIARRYEKLPFELARYNEIPRNVELQEGQMVYLQPKRRKAAPGVDYHETKEGDTMHSVSQLYGIKLGHLYKKNLMKEGSEPEIGQKLWLRKKKKRMPTLDLQLKEPEQDEEPEFEIEFDG